MATDYLSEALGVSPPNPLLESISGSDATGNLWSQLNTWIEGLASTQRTKVVAAIQKWGAGQRTGGFGSTFGFGPGGLQLSQIQQLATTLQGAYGSTTAPVPGSTTAPTAKPLTAEQQKEAASNTVQSSATTAATTATAQLPESTVGNVAPGIPVVGSAGATIPGTSTPSDFNSLLQNYYQQEFATAGGDPTKLATAAGMTPQNLQAQYQAYTTGLQKAFANVPQGAGAYTPLSMEQFAQNKAQSMIGPWASVLSAISTIWQSQYQQTLPPELAAQIVSSLNSMPQSQQSNVLYNAYQYMTNSASAATNKSLFDQTGSYASAILSSLPSSILTYTSGSGTGTGALGTGGLVGTYA